MQKILVAGATGFVGSHVLEALQGRDDVHLIAACRDPARLPDHFRGEVRAGDLRDPAYARAAVEGVDTLCLCAAWSSLWGNRENSERLFLQPVLQLIEAAEAAGVRRVINTSTTSAAAPEHSADPQSRGIPRSFWPHLGNVIAIEEALRERAKPGFQVVNLRLGIFVGRRYGLGVLPILLPRLKTHLVPWVAGGRTGLPLIDGEDIGQAFALAATTPGLSDYEGFNIVGPEIPSVRQAIAHLHTKYGYPQPHFSVPFPVAYAFAGLMEAIDPLLPWEPLVTRSIIHLLEDTGADNGKAERLLGYRPRHHWQAAIAKQVAEMAERQTYPMKMYRPIS
ncbi:nucleoside-diphosphate-sugar epimerase [Sulfuritortus calidifontis]|uniref:Nucleoside-diphosphate-sugar epimerase n=1 Tax=Sulfuritortus calidifontis TaxID=1914471 RepID=A0A4R3JYZ9_9PROT|nr:NAD(P)-dependent oxidoreductase [Sulfuritortus calidifontis]TCS72704.1 nucleoside-diphosphate-sugar epimerase [Sulfuritortus calidifontis]